LAEAVALSDRILVMSERPGTIVEQITVDLPDRSNPMQRRKHESVGHYVAMLMDMLKLDANTECTVFPAPHSTNPSSENTMSPRFNRPHRAVSRRLAIALAAATCLAAPLASHAQKLEEVTTCCRTRNVTRVWSLDAGTSKRLLRCRGG
jgi:hypothetical protein